MSNVIDERVVEMKFDNQQFENNIKTSMSTLDKLKEALKLEGASSGLDEVSKSAKNMDLSAISKGVAALEDRFSTFGIIGMEVITNLTDAAMNFAGNVMSKVSDSIIGGGLNRAKNIENAHFQLQGLLKDEELVQQIMAEAMESVDGTAYGYDVAAKAASMFASSGIKAGERMEVSLRALAGTTAMTGRSYEDIANIFTTISGQGRILGNQLNQFAASGVNVAATLAQYYREVKGEVDMTEQGIRDLISSKDTNIYFDEFADAMNWAFGDQAKKANETFSGSMDNIKAALSRVGAKFFQPLIAQNSQMVELFNAIRVRINDINKMVDPFAAKFVYIINSAAEALTNFLKNSDHDHMIVENMTKAYHIFSNTLFILRNVLLGVGSAIKPAIQGLQRFIPFDLLNRLQTFTMNLKDLTYGMKVSDQTAMNIRKTFSGISAIFHIVGQAINAVARVFGADLLNGLTNGTSGILEFTAGIGDWLVNLDKAISEGDIFFNVLSNISSGISQAVSAIREFVGSAIGTISGAFGQTAQNIQKFFGGLFTSLTGFSNIGDLFESVKSNFKNAIDSIKDFTSLKITPPDISLLDGFIEKIKNMSSPLETVGNVFKTVFSGIHDVLALVSPYIYKVIAFIGTGIQSLFEKLSGVATKDGKNIFSKIFDMGILAAIGFALASLSSHMISITTVISTFMSKILGIDIKTIKNIAVSIGILAASLVAMSLIDTNKLYATLGAVTALIYELVAAMKAINGLLMSEKGGIIGGLENFMNSFAMSTMTTGMIKMAAAMVILAGAMKIMGSLNPNELITALTGIGISLAIFVQVFKSMPKEAAIIRAATSILILSTAMTVLGAALHIIGSLNPNELVMALVGMGTSLAIFVAVFKNMKAEGIGKSAASILILSTAMTVLGAALHIMGSLNVDQLVISLTALGVSLAAMVIALRNMPTTGTAASAAALLLLAGALVVIGGALHIMASLNVEQLAISLTALGGSLFIMVMALNALSSAGAVAGGAAAILIMSVALIALGGALKIFASIPLPSIGTGLLAMAGALATLLAAGMLAIVAAPGLIALSVAMGALGVACLAAGAGVSMFAAGLAAISVVGVGAVTVFVKMLETLVVGIANAITNSAGAIKEAVVTVLLVAIEAFSEVASGFVDNAINLIDTVLAALVKHGPALVDKLIDFLIGVIDKLAARVPELATSIANLISTVINTVIDIVNGIDTSSLIDALKFSGIIAAFLLAMAGLSTIAGPAMLGVLAFGALIVELTAVLATIGAINKIPGLKEFVESGGDLLQAIGTAIGQFVGGFIGGVAEGIFAQLPQMASDLSMFMMNLQPFLIGARMIKPEMMEGVQSLAKTILILTAADILNGIASFFGVGGSSLAKFGQELESFGPHIKKFSDDVSGIDSGAVQGAADAGKVLAEMASALPNNGGLAGKIFGENSLAEFGKELESFGPHIATFAEQVKDVKPEAVQGASDAAQIMANMANNLPNNGGLAGKIFGENPLSEFGQELESFGPHIAAFSEQVKDVTGDSVQGAADAAQIMSKMATDLPESGGLAQKIFGERSLSEFGKELVKFGIYITEYSNEVSGIDVDAVTATSNAAKCLAELANAIPESGGLISIFTGDNTLDTFGAGLKKFGTAFQEFSQSVAGIVYEDVYNAVACVRQLVHLGEDMTMFDTSAYSTFASGLKLMANNAIQEFCNAFNMCTDRVTAAVNVLFTTASSLVNAQSVTLHDAGVNAGNQVDAGLAEGIQALQSQVITTIRTTCDMVLSQFRSLLPKVQFNTIAQNHIMMAFIEGLKSKVSALQNEIEKICKDIIDKFDKNLPKNKFATFGKRCIEGIIEGLNDSAVNSKLNDTIVKICDNIKKKFEEAGSGEKMKKVGVDMMKGLIKGIEDEGKNLYPAIQKLVNEAIAKTRKQLEVKSPSKVFYRIGKYVSQGMANGISDYGDEVIGSTEGMANNTIDAMRTAIAKISDMIESDMDVQPTITPIVDLSNIQNGSKKIKGMLTKGINVSMSYGNALAASGSQNYSNGSAGSLMRSSTVSNNYNFTQNNYSPKALSQKEIYRQTRNQFSQLKGMVSTT